MPKRSSTNCPRDVNQLAAALVNEAVGEGTPAPSDDGKDPAAAALGRKGGRKGGPAHAKALTGARREEIARQAAAARWGDRELHG